MDVQFIIDQLPAAPDEGVRAFVTKNWHELGGFVTLYKRIHVRELPNAYLVGDLGSSNYVAECWCSECGNTWHTAWGGDKSLIVADGDDGMTYPISPAAAAYGADLVSRIEDGGLGICPMCGEGVTFRHVSKFGNRQMTRRHFMVFRNMGGYTALVSWLACREIYADRSTYFEIVPWVANVIDEQGRLRAFRFDPGSRRWRRASGSVDPETTAYLSGEGYYGYVRGGFIELPQDDLDGQTGEKTGIREYLNADGCFASHYLRVWRKHRSIENLMKTGFCKIASRMVNNDASRYYTNPYEGVDFSKAKPHEMVGMLKADFNVLCAEGWGFEQFDFFQKCHAVGLVDSVASFSAYWSAYKAEGVRAMISMAGTLPGLTMGQINRYLVGKQNLLPADLHHLADTWRMFQLVHLRPPRTAEELWPRNLIETHDTLSALVSMKSSDAANQRFQQTAELLQPLAWTDGELCIVIPTCPADLAREGRVLRHCVGGHCSAHVNGSPIFFVRHYRRPERPYYTLNIGLTQKMPVRQQLHGYGNERHGAHKQYSHSIPKKVLAFCDRWEREVLLPWWIAKQKEVNA